ncbi:hypothetical protein P152DRAFT_59025 [Eremomyces bilateralis CBS 781.70]|uniref:Uncharacterized protein n=1 Tax=Eremomyces bilateralis CBS 781.70 TaxID=1392243 RepID=A0A6G1G0A1_9PEZI|nr:uncharacterized protein P152DRAFT_59025 [Eremomyces bilateralis CBS 781.70]KAF1811535.1 hypothetical protein P152DRAFT_59025 [Eremomyces bilateralis CBS 781.70]
MNSRARLRSAHKLQQSFVASFFYPHKPQSFTPIQNYGQNTRIDDEAEIVRRMSTVGDLGLTDDAITALDGVQLDKLCRERYGVLWTTAGKLEQIRWWYLGQNQKRWGWRIYRTTYDSEVKWERFIQIFNEALISTIREVHGNEEHMKFMEWPIMSDRERFNEASTIELRKHFLAWRSGGGPIAAEPQLRNEKSLILFALSRPKYDYFIQVDKESIDNILAQNDPVDGYVNVVQADWPGDDPDELDDIEANDGYPVIEGRSTHDIGFQRVRLAYLYPDFYEEVKNLERRYWYRRPPEIYT